MEQVDKANKSEETLREATREANQAISELRSLFKEIKEFIANEPQNMIDKQVEVGLNEYKETCNAAIEKAEEIIFQRFNKLVNAITGEDGKKKRELTSFEQIIAVQACERAVNEYRKGSNRPAVSFDLPAQGYQRKRS